MHFQRLQNGLKPTTAAPIDTKTVQHVAVARPRISDSNLNSIRIIGYLPLLLT